MDIIIWNSYYLLTSDNYQHESWYKDWQTDE